MFLTFDNKSKIVWGRKNVLGRKKFLGQKISLGQKNVEEKKIPFPVWIIPFPVLKISFGLASNS